MGKRTTQRIFTCAICGRTPEDGEFIWEMCGEHWCETCIDEGNCEDRGMDTNASVLSYEMNNINVDAKWREQVEAQKAEIERLQSEIDCEERRFNDLSDDYAALSKKNDKMREVLTELQQCSDYWSEYDVPLGIHDRIKEALKDDA